MEAFLTSGTVVQTLLVIARTIASDSLLVLVGGIIFLSAVRIPYSPTRRSRWLDTRAHYYLWATWALTFLGSLSVFLLRGPAATGTGLRGVVDAELQGLTLDSRFGLAYTIRFTLLLIAVPLLLAGWPWPGGRRRSAGHRRPGWLLAAALLLTPPLSGHSGQGTYPIYGIVVGITHFTSAAIWFGGLILLFVCLLPRVEMRLKEYVPKFSAIAFWSFVIATISGSLQSWRQLGGELENLTSTTYGWLLVGKLAFFVILLAIANGSRDMAARSLRGPSMSETRRLGPDGAVAANERANSARLRHLIIGEFVVVVGVLVFTAAMTNVVPSYEEVATRDAAARAADQQERGGSDVARGEGGASGVRGATTRGKASEDSANGSAKAERAGREDTSAGSGGKEPADDAGSEFVDGLDSTTQRSDEQQSTYP